VKTWHCTFEVKIDLPTTMTTWAMEAAVAQALAVALPSQGLAGNCIVTLKSTEGGVSVLDSSGEGGVMRQDSPNAIGVLSDSAIDTPDIIPTSGDVL
jgi:hypothetical protein